APAGRKPPTKNSRLAPAAAAPRSMPSHTIDWYGSPNQSTITPSVAAWPPRRVLERSIPLSIRPARRQSDTLFLHLLPSADLLIQSRRVLLRRASGRPQILPAALLVANGRIARL